MKKKSVPFTSSPMNAQQPDAKYINHLDLVWGLITQLSYKFSPINYPIGY